MHHKIDKKALDELYEVILAIENKEECYAFFEDLCTVNELQALSQRLQVAKMLRDKHTYTDIADATSASTATISRVNRSLNYGNEGYNSILNRMK